MLFCLDEDEDGDRITVRSDEELRAMIDVCFQSCQVMINKNNSDSERHRFTVMWL